MKDFAFKFINQVRREATRRGSPITIVSGGRKRTFFLYDWGTDTFIFERDVWKLKPSHAPVLIIRKNALINGRDGHIMSVTSGSHATAAIPLLRGDFPILGHVPARRRSDVMTHSVLCANVVNDGETIEISQRDISVEEMHASDEWLRSLGWSLRDVVLAERTDSALEFYRRRGQEWRIKPLVWTRAEMDFALAASRTRIHSTFSYYHSVKGVHFLSYEDFSALLPLCSADFEAVKICINELVKPAEVGEIPAMLDPKFRGHHEIELFGIRDPAASARIVRRLVDLQKKINSLSPEQCEDLLAEIINIYHSALSFPALADSGSELFVSSMYKHLTGEIYNTQDQVVPAFDDRKTALPGATFRGGKPDFHIDADDRTHALIEYAETLLSAGEQIECVNVYELRGSNPLDPGTYPTREIEFKTNFRPVSIKLIEKKLSQGGIEYASYMLARVQAFQSLGIAFGDHHLLQRRDRVEGNTNYFVRNRYPGFAMNAISHNRFKRPVGINGEFVDFPEAVLKTAALVGRAAAHTMIVKKYIKGADPIRFGMGKEIIEFDHDIAFGCEMPCAMRLCSVRGALGWPCIDKTRENLDVCFSVYTESFAKAVVRFWRKIGQQVALDVVMNDFCAGFASAMREIYWNYYNRRELFNSFDPCLRSSFKFRQKWQFVLWSLSKQYENVNRLSAMIKVAAGHIAAREDGLDLRS